jgi:hypothetical protein
METQNIYLKKKNIKQLEVIRQTKYGRNLMFGRLDEQF